MYARIYMAIQMLVGIFLSNQFLQKVAIELLEHLAKKTDTDIDDEGVRLFKNYLEKRRLTR